MNATISDFAKGWIKEHLAKLPPSNQRIFRLMYGRDKGRRSVDDAVALGIDQILSEMEPWHLDHAMTQIENSLKQLEASR